MGSLLFILQREAFSRDADVARAGPVLGELLRCHRLRIDLRRVRLIEFQRTRGKEKLTHHNTANQDVGQHVRQAVVENQQDSGVRYDGGDRPKDDNVGVRQRLLGADEVPAAGKDNQEERRSYGA